jgi:hypothetical protein
MQGQTKAEPKESGESINGERSTIEFPYTDLDNAVETVRGVHAVGGTACDYDQLAAQLNVEAKGGGFRLRVNGAKTYGLITYERGGRITLTELGRKIVDSEQERAARLDAFLAVPLFGKVYETYRGSQLPPQAGLERSLVGMGVGKKVADRARQVLLRSAKQAGFFELSQDRLTAPSVKTASHQNEASKDHEKKHKPTGGGGPGDHGFHPFIEGLLKTLPTPETSWSIPGRVKWLQAASHVFDLIYTNDEQNQQGVEYIEISKKTL